MTGEPTDEARALALEEFRSLRATIRERGTLRLLVIALTFMTWAALATLLVGDRVAGLTLVPLLALAAGFEVTFATHVGVERIGRYLQARYEGSPEGPGWEHLAMAGGPAVPGLDPIARRLFSAAAVVNLLPAVLWLTAGTASPLRSLLLAVELLAHALFLLRLSTAARFVAGQRNRDLAYFQERLPPVRS